MGNRPFGLWFCLVVFVFGVLVWLFAGFWVFSCVFTPHHHDVFPFLPMMTWAHRPHGVRTRAKEKSEYNPANLNRCLPECCFLEAGLTSLTLPPDFNWIGPAVCELCLQLELVDLSRTEVTEIMGSAFAHCKHLRSLRLPHKLRVIEQEAFLKCTSLTEVSVPPTLLYIARRAFAGCKQLNQFQRAGKCMTWRGTYSRANAFLRCDNLDMPQWVRWLPRTSKDEDKCVDDSYAVYS